MRDGDLPLYYENEIITRDEKRRLVRWSNTVLRNPAGNIVGSVSLGEDVTERKQADEKIREQLDELLRWQEVMLGREERMLQLKAEVNELLARRGEPARYPSQADA